MNDSLRADRLDDRVRAEPVGELLDLLHAFLAALLDDVGRAVVAGELLPLRMARHGDDALRAELLGGEDRHQSDGSIADDGDGLAGACFGGDGGEPAGAEHVGGSQQRRVQLRSRACRGSSRACRRHAGCGPAQPGCRSGPCTNSACTHLDWKPAWQISQVLSEITNEPTTKSPGLTVWTSRADLFDDADVLVAHHGVVGRLDAAVGPEVRSADAGRRQSDDRRRSGR